MAKYKALPYLTPAELQADAATAITIIEAAVPASTPVLTVLGAVVANTWVASIICNLYNFFAGATPPSPST